LKVAPGGSDDADIMDGDESPLGNFLDDVALVSDVKSGDDSGDSRLVVNLMTIHASKGTEFDAVFVVGNEEGTLPSSMSMQEGEDSIAMEEEKRLCYVAMTRAKTRLVLTWRKEVTMWSSWSDDGAKASTKERSRFLNALVKRPAGGQTKSKKINSSSSIDADRALQQRRRTNAAGPSQPPRRQSMHDQMLRNRVDTQQNNAGRPRQGQINSNSNLRNDMSRRTAPPSSQQQRTSPSRQARSPTLGTQTGATPTSRRDSSAASTSAPANRQRTQPASQSNSRPAPAPPASKSFDSTLFYPVGSDVIHNNFGKGVVLQPPPSTDSTKLPVRVQFDNGRTKEFPADGNDLVPVF
jgi:ATP-dependent exoDNAse (exonuclease V) beta subunit